MTNIGRFLREQEIAQGISSGAMAGRMGLPRPQYSRIKTGITLTPNTATLDKMICGISEDLAVRARLVCAFAQDIRDRTSGYPREILKIQVEGEADGAPIPDFPTRLHGVLEGSKPDDVLEEALLALSRSAPKNARLRQAVLALAAMIDHS